MKEEKKGRRSLLLTPAPPPPPPPIYLWRAVHLCRSVRLFPPLSWG